MLVSLISLMNAVVRTGGLFAIVPMLATASLGLSVSAIGFAMMLGSVDRLFAAYPAGWLTDRYGRKAVIVPATVMTGASMLLFCFAPNLCLVHRRLRRLGRRDLGSAAPRRRPMRPTPPRRA